MKYIITESQYNLVKEYFDPVYFLKNKFGKKDGQVKDPQFVPYEEKFQKIVDIIFKLTVKMNGPLKHLNGLEVLKVTPTSTDWTVLVRPIVDDWFNWRGNSEFIEDLREFKISFMEVARMGGFDSPHDEEGLPKNIDIHFYLN